MTKHIDTDGDLESFADRKPASFWEFEAAFENDVEIVSADPDTNGDDDPADWLIEHPGVLTSVVVMEVPQDGYRLLAASCIDADDALGMEIPTTLEGNSLSFEVSGGAEPNFERSFVCDFINSPEDVSLAGISVWKHVDTDGNLATFEDQQFPRSWEFEAAFEDDVEILFADPDTDRDEPAGWLVGHTGDSTRVVVTEVPKNGYQLVKASCIDGDLPTGRRSQQPLRATVSPSTSAGTSRSSASLMGTSATS